MKSKHRHDLETNELARRLYTLIDRIRPYSSTVLGSLIAIVVILMGWSYLSGSSAARKEQAWALYNVAVESAAPNLALLRQSAQDNPGTKMQELADMTWADGQVWGASQAYARDRAGANTALNRAESVYQGILQSSKDERLLGRARFGLGRIYEVQDKLDQAREQYAAVQGDFAPLAQARAKLLEDPQVKEACAWLASATLPPRVAPAGPGTPGQRPDFSASDLSLPGESPKAGSSTDAMLEGLDLGIKDSQDRYKQGDDDFFGSTPTDQPAESDQPTAPADDANQPQR
jgi:predicted negative regulator of RcsB-dependent stress response